MNLLTASAAIRFSEELETYANSFYERMMQRFPEREQELRVFVQENRKFVSEIQRAYYSVISDALEGCFAFENVDTDDYSFNPVSPESQSMTEMLEEAVAMEETIMKFYQVAHQTSRSLIADVSLVFRKIARKREERIRTIQAILLTE